MIAALLSTLTSAPTSHAAEPTEEQLAKAREALPETAPARPKKERKVLVFSRTNGFRHSSIEMGAATLKLLGDATDAFSVTHTEDESAFEKESLIQYDAVIMLNTTGEIFRPRNWSEDSATAQAEKEREERLKTNLESFVKNGGGLIGMHSATDTYKNWDAYNEMMGGAFAGHPWHTLVALRIHEPHHPLLKMFREKTFEVADEIYQFRNDTASPSGRRMLMSLSGTIVDLEKGNRDDGFYPVSWVSNYGTGRTFYCSLGHREEIFWNPTVLKHYLAGIQFALGDLEAPAEPVSVE